MSQKSGVVVIHWLTSLDLESFIQAFADKETREAFLGVFPIDHLPKKPYKFPLFFIINTNTHNLPGEHWKAIYISKQHIGEVFDSLALPIGLRLQQWMNEFCKKWSFSKLTIQNPLKPSCGGYVLFFIMSRLKHDSMKACLTYFTKDTVVNDLIVNKFIESFLQ